MQAGAGERIARASDASTVGKGCGSELMRSFLTQRRKDAKEDNSEVEDIPLYLCAFA